MKYLFFIFIIYTFYACVPISSSTTSGSKVTEQKTLELSDHIYEDNIKTVLLYLFDGSGKDVLNPAAVSIDQRQPLMLEFDDLQEEVQTYNAKIIHCNADWSKSLLNEMEFLYDYNEFYIEEYEYSFNTLIPYVHYMFEVPKVKLPGNYVLSVYRDQNEDDIVLTKRFIVFDNAVSIGFEVGTSTGIVERDFNQQAEFAINYSDYDIANPYQDLNIVVRQNQRWDNAITDLKPTSIREDQRLLLYRHFNLENNFRGGNEFRYFDLRSINFVGQNVSNIEEQQNRIQAFLFKDRIRGNEAYAEYLDLNGEYLVENIESGENLLEAEYVDVYFYLEAAEPFNNDLYILGEMTQWNFNEENKMKYDPELNAYTGHLLLKQGWYNYIYYLKGSDNPYSIEGSHFETENEYDVLVYYRPPGFRADLLVGYKSMNYSPGLR